MTRLLLLNKLLISIIFFILLFQNFSIPATTVDIWKKNEGSNKEKIEDKDKKEIIIKSPILSGSIEKITINIDEQKIEDFDQTVVGLFDPEKNNFNLDMWAQSDGKDIKDIFNRINKLKLSKFSEDLLFQILFTNAYPPQKNLSSKEFLKIKINWLIKNERFRDLENLLITNPQIGTESKAIKFLVNENLASADIKSACEKTKALEKSVENNYLEKFKIYCLINDDRKDEAQLVFDLLKERGFNDKFFEDKINFLLGITDKTSEKILDNNLLNFYLSSITSENFEYEPTDKTDKYIWKYLSSANLIKTDDFENEDIILAYEQAAAENSLEANEVFKIYLQMSFNFNQLMNSTEIYKNLPNYKARALIYQSMLLSDNVERKLYLAFLLKDLFLKDKLFETYSQELSDILNAIKPDEIPKNYAEEVEKNLEQNNKKNRKIKYDNYILHRSKVIKYFIDNSDKTAKAEKDFKTVYKKIKKNKKYFISIKDIVVLESLEADGVNLPNDLDYSAISSELTVPKNLEDLVEKNQMGLVMLKIIEIIGEDSIENLDPETIYFLSKILNDLNLKKIRNNILSEALPIRA